MRWWWQKDPDRERIYRKQEAVAESMTRSAERLELVTKRIERLLESTAEGNNEQPGTC